MCPPALKKIRESIAEAGSMSSDQHTHLLRRPEDHLASTWTRSVSESCGVKLHNMAKVDFPWITDMLSNKVRHPATRDWILCGASHVMQNAMVQVACSDISLLRGQTTRIRCYLACVVESSTLIGKMSYISQRRGSMCM